MITYETSSVDIMDSIEQYLQEASRMPLLKAREEQQIGKAIKVGQHAGRAWLKASAAERQQFEPIISQGFEAMQRLANANLRLVISIAKRYQDQSGLTLLDLIQEGNIGLLRATRKFDYTRGLKFSTYATWWIRQAITRAMAEKGGVIRKPVHVHDKERKLGRVRTQFLLAHEREPNAQELAELANCKIKQAEQYLLGRGYVASLDEIRDGEEHHLAMFIPDEHAPDPEATAVWKAQHHDIHVAIESTLTERERDVITRRYGLNGSKSEKLESIGVTLDITRERVRQIEAEALRKLASGKAGSRLRAYLDQDTRVEQDM